MTQPLNVYGDNLTDTMGRHGADISSQRIDDLDVAALLYAIRERDRPGIAIDLGCGIGILGLRFAALGFVTILLDRVPVEQTVLRVSGLEQMLPLSYLMKDARALSEADLPNELALCYSQRFIHYLQFSDAVALLRLLRSKMRPNSKLFLSASGLLSELGNGYDARHQKLDERFSVLAPNNAAKHG